VRTCSAATCVGFSVGRMRRTATGAVQLSRSGPSWTTHWYDHPSMTGTRRDAPRKEQ